MARGWESKAIEEQISAAQARKEAQARRTLSEFEIEQQVRREGLLMERTRILRELQATRNERYRALMERTLAHVESELAGLGPSSSST